MADDAPAEPTAYQHLEAIVGLSPAPEYRRFGSPGMAHVADYVAGVLTDAGYAVSQREVAANRWQVEYAPGHEPMLEILATGALPATESAFSLGATTTAQGVTCVVRAIEDVQPGDCGWVPFEVASPEWNNVTADPSGAVADIATRGGVAAVIEGDTSRDALLALQIRQSLPAVVVNATEAEVVGQQVRVRAMGAPAPATTHDVVAMRPPADPSRGYVVLLGHLDGWFAAAADNGSGSAAILRAARLLADQPPSGAGVLVVLVDGEEVGMHGSRAVAADLGSEAGLVVDPHGPALHWADLEAVLNLDAPTARPSDVQEPIAGGPTAEPPVFQWRAFVLSGSVALMDQFVVAFAAHGVLGLPIKAGVAEHLNGGMNRTDARWFRAARIPVFWPVTGYPEYHTSADTLAAVDPVDLEALAEGSADALRAVGA